MIVTAYNNGAHIRNGTGFGLNVCFPDRDQFFKKEWEKIVLEFEESEEKSEVPLDKVRFWSEACPPVISLALGKWLRHHGLAPWVRGNPPTFILDPIADNRFTVRRVHSKTHNSPLK
jgi:hypothetical protein